MPRARKGLTRKSTGQAREPYVIFVIATEGSETEPAYFRHVRSRLEQLGLDRLVKIEPLERPVSPYHSNTPQKDTRSDVEAVIDLLDDYKRKYTISTGDELWCVIDRDRWLTRNIAAAAQRCRQKGYEFCMTTPCFEFWLLLHLFKLTDISNAEQEALLANRRDGPGDRTRSEHLLNEQMKSIGMGAYRKSRLPDFSAHIANAVQQAFELALDDGHWQENRFCTRLHVLLQRMLKLEVI